jgi:sirohydrochlorin cobaltochelatase
VSDDDFSDAALVLLGHGTIQNPDSSAPVYQHAAELRKLKMFLQVREAFWKQDPQVTNVFKETLAIVPAKPNRIFVVPLFISEGYFSENIIPDALGFQREQRKLSRVQRSGVQLSFFCNPIGNHESMTEVLLTRAREVVQRFPFPRAPVPKDITLFIAGHGTGRDANSRAVVDHHARSIRARNLYAAVHTVFLDDEPPIAACYNMAQTRNLVVVPFFISDGLHVREDIPVLLGEPERIVSTRLAQGQPTWRNPTEKHGKLVWYSPSVGTDPSITKVILERVREAAKWHP